MANWLDKTFYNIDYSIAKFFSNLESKGMSVFMEIISFLGKSGIFFIAVGLILCIFIKTRRMGATILFSILIGAIITSIILKPLIQRARPFSHEDLDFYEFWIKAGKHSQDGYSFPSGHTTACMAFSLSIFAMSKHKKYTFPILLFPIFMASSRIYLMVHYFSDCIFGLISGAIGTLIAYFITKLIFDKTKGKFNNFINNYSFKELFKNKENK